jgi:hypothetical protein
MQRKKPDCQAHMYAYQLQILTLTRSIRQNKHSHQPNSHVGIYFIRMMHLIITDK